jgi:BACON domain-containing protein
MNFWSPTKLFSTTLAMACVLTSASAASTAISRHAPATRDLGGTGGIGLAVTISTDTTADSCGTATELDVAIGQQVNFCYVVTNNSTTTLNYHALGDDAVGPIVPILDYALAPGASYQYNRIISATASQSPTSTWTAYSDLPLYTYDDTVSADFIDITATGTPLNLYSDESVGVTMDFPFTFYDVSSNQITIGNNGGIVFGTEDGAVFSFTSALPDANLGAAILPYWTNIADDTGNVYYATLGTAPNRQFVVEWYDRNHDGTGGGPNSPGGATFEAVLYENGDQILFNYQTASFGDPTFDDGATATVGLNGDASHATQYSRNQAVLHDGLAILFTPNYGTVYSASQQVSLTVGAPVAGVSPTAISASVAAGSAATAPLTISNSGNVDLAWHVGQAPSRVHFPPVSRFVLPLGDPSRKHPGRASLPVGSVPNRRIALPFGTEVPAFAFDESNGPSNGIYVSLDANAPQAPTTLGPSPSPIHVFAGDFFGNDFSVEYAVDTNTNILYAVSTTTAAASPIATMTPLIDNYDWSALRWDSSTSTAYAVLVGPIRRNPLSPWYSNLYTVDPASGVSTLVGPIQNIADPTTDILMTDIAISADGLVYGLDLVSSSLMAIDKTSGAASVIGSIGFDANSAQSMDFDDATGILYLAGCVNNPTINACDQSNMYTVDTGTGLATLIAPIGGGPIGAELGGLAIANVSGCSSPDTMSWLSFDPASGTTAPGASTNITATLDASTLAPGAYSGTTCVFSDDPTQRVVRVPVSLDVSADADTIFANGFDP